MEQVPINRHLWSRSSQRSSGGHYDSAATNYENIAYRCLACGSSSLFTAEQQRIAYEVNKKFIWWVPKLCTECGSRRDALIEQGRNFQKTWNQSKDSLVQDMHFLAEWLALLEKLRELAKPNDSMERMLRKRLHELRAAS